MPSRISSALLVVLVGLGALLRFATLGKQSFWIDEAFVYQAMAGGFAHVWTVVRQVESTPPLYYVLLWPWSRLFGLGEDGLRSFSAACGTLTIPVVWVLGRQLASERVALMGAALTAGNPLLLWYGQEARAYALLALMSAGTLVALVWAARRPTTRRLAGWSILAALALCTHYFALFLLIPEAGWLLLALRRGAALSWGRLIALLGPVVAMGLALAPLAVAQIPHAASVKSTAPLASALTLAYRQGFLGYGGPAWAGTALDVLLLALIAVVLLRRVDREERSALELGAGLGALALAAAVLFSVAGTDYISTRNLLEIWPALGLAAAAILAGVRPRPLGVLGLGALVGLGLLCWHGLMHQPWLQRADWRGTWRAIAPPSGARVIVSYRTAGVSLSPYTSSLTDYPPAGARIREIDVLSPLGTWNGAVLHPLRAAPPPPGFQLARRLETSSYLVIRYSARRPRLEARPELATMYPGLARVGVFLEVTREAAQG